MGEKKITKRVRYVLKLVDLSDKHDCFPNQLSTGERQRVAIARALVNNPHVIIADEPTGNLDPVLSSDIMSLFDKINSLGATVVVVTHDLELVHQFDHRVVTIENGKIVSDVPARYNMEIAPHRPEAAITAVGDDEAQLEQYEEGAAEYEADEAATETQENSAQEESENG
jgi:ABC-type methionine transport system ATPase subunit